MRAFSKMADLPIQLMFRLFPFISLAVFATGGGEVNYDPFWAAFLALFLAGRLFGRRIKFERSHVRFLKVVIFLAILKYVLPYIFVDKIQVVALVMDGKWLVYIVLSILWIDTYGYPSLEKTYKAGVFFSVIYIGKVFYLLASQHGLSRGGLLLEANYDGFMILMVYCFSSEAKIKKKWEDLILLFATFMTLSRTGFASLFAVWIIMAARKNLFWLVLLVPVLGGMAYLGLMMRGMDSAGHLDRFVYWNQAFIAFEYEDFWNYLFGNTPGLPLKMPILSDFLWTIDTFEETRNVRGIFPFMFHSAYLRLAFTWGIPLVVFLVFYFIRKFYKAKYLPLKRLCILILVQSFSLSTLTIPNVSLLLFITYMLAIHEDKLIKTQNI